jgi:hypothetical protein
MATYVNDLRLTELATGEGSGTWGTTTNVSLELIGEALGYATQQVFGSDADATTTIADGASDPARAMYFKITSAGSLTATRTCTIAPNTVSRVMFIENATTGSQSIAISQGSGANVTILTGKTAVVYLDGAGSGAAVIDAMAGVDPGVTDTLTEVLVAGNTSGGTNIELSTTDKVQFRDAAIYINSSVDGQLDIVADTEVQIAATTIDINGAINASGEIIAASLDISGDIDVDGTTNLDVVDIDGAVDFASTTAHAGNAAFADDAKAIFGAGSDLQIFHNGSNSYITEVGTGSLIIRSATSTIFQGATAGENKLILTEDGAVSAYYDNALKLATTATGIQVTGNIANASGDMTLDVAGDINLDADGGDVRFKDGGTHIGSLYNSSNNFAIYSAVNNADLLLQGQDGGSTITALTLDMSAAGAATFNSSVTAVSGVFKNAADATGTTIKVQDNADRGITITSPIAASSAAGRIATSGTANSLEIGVRDYPTALTIAGGSGAATFSSTVTSTGLPLSVNTSLYNSNASLSYYAADNAVYLNGAGDAGWLRLQASGTSNGSNYIDIFGSGQGSYIVFKAGSTNSLNLNTGSAVFNESGADVDFRAESNSNTHMLFVDGGNDRVGIGESAPATYLDLGFTSIDQTDGIQIHNKQYGGYGGAIEWYSRTAASLGGGSDRLAGQIQVAGANNWVSDENVESTMKFSLIEDNVFKNILELNPTSEVVVNQDSLDIDFRVESDGHTHALFVDGGTNNVGIGTGSPISLDGNAAPGLTISSNGPFLVLQDANNADKVNYIANNTGVMQFGLVGDNGTTGKTEVMSLSSAGAIFNEGHDAALDFRVESDSDSYAIFVDASADKVAIGTTPSNHTGSKFVVEGRTTLSNGSTTAGSVLLVDSYSVTNDDHILNIGTQKSSGGPFISYGLGQNGSDADWVSTYDNFDGSHCVMLLNGSTLEYYLDTSNSQTTLGDAVPNIVNGFKSGRSGMIFNDDGMSGFDFRVESNTNTHMLFVDSGNDRVAIGGTGYTNDTDLNLLGAGLSIKNDKDGSNNNWSLIQNTGTSTGSNLKFSLATGNVEFTTGGSIVASTAANYHTIFNEGGVDADFRVESDTNTHAIFLDAGNSRVGINDSAPDQALTVNGTIQAINSNLTTIDASASATVLTPPRGYSYINVSRSDTTAYGLLLLVFRTSSVLSIVSTVDNRASSKYSASTSGTGLVVTNDDSSQRGFYASCVSIGFGTGD